MPTLIRSPCQESVDPVKWSEEIALAVLPTGEFARKFHIFGPQKISNSPKAAFTFRDHLALSERYCTQEILVAIKRCFEY
jgi:hypothetical protein